MEPDDVNSDKQKSPFSVFQDSPKSKLRQRLVGVDSNKDKERSQLLSAAITSYKVRSPFERNKNEDDKESLTRQTASNATSSLSRSHSLLLETVSRSTLTLEQLGQTTAKVEETNEELLDQSSTIRTSKSLLSKYGRRELTDRLLIFLAFIMFLGVVFYILRKRL